MIRSLGLFFSLVFIALSSSGCFLLIAGAAGGAGTAVWLSEKISQDVGRPYNVVVEAAKNGLGSLHLKVDKETSENGVTQLRGDDKGRPYWVDIRSVTALSCRIEVRVGVPGEKKKSRQLMDAILRYL